MDYKDTLLMPYSAFEMRGNLPNKEPLIMKRWYQDNMYQQLLKAHQGQPLFLLHDGPPYANGNLHAGTAMNRIIKDIIVRSHAMNGYYTPFFPGWDTHGLPIENAIQKLGINPKEISISEFRQKCEQYAYNQIATQKETMKRLGTIADYDNPYITLKKEYESRQIISFSKMAIDGLIYQGLKPIYWSPFAETAVADSEIVYFDKTDPTVFVKFDVIDGNNILSTNDSIVIWTTTPWTLPANLAICLNKAYTYALVETSIGNLLLLESKVDELLTKFNLTKIKIINTYKGHQLEMIKTSNPLYDNRESLVILGDHVTDQDGTGCVHTAPGHGADDFYIGAKYGLEAYCPVDEQGRMTIDAGEDLKGLYVDDASKVVIDILTKNKHLIFCEYITHSYPFDERLKKPVIFRATVQWFASISLIKDRLLKEIDNVVWENQWGKVRIHNMIKDRLDWCISRQRRWGVPIPIIYNEDNSPIIDKEVFDHIASLIKEHGSNIWFNSEPIDLLPKGYTNKLSPNNKFTKEEDIMDVWFDSGSSHNEFQTRGFNYRCDLYFEGSDQYRGWFNSSLIIGVATKGKAPYKRVLSHGYVCDSKGEKMSKSIGNVIDPNNVIKQYGADILRLWSVNVDIRQDMRIGDDNLKQVIELYRKIRNTFKFMLGNLKQDDFNPNSDLLTYQDLTLVDQHIMVLLNDLNIKVKNDYLTFNYLHASNLIMNFISNELSSYYLDFTKDILYIEKIDYIRRRQVQSVLYNCVDTLVRLLAPVLTYTCDEIWEHFNSIEKDNVHLLEFKETYEYDNSDILKEDFNKLMLFKDDILKALEIARSDKIIGKPLEASLILEVKDEYKVLIDKYLNDSLAQWLIVSNIVFKSNNGLKLDTCNVLVEFANGELCPRCWNIKETNNDNCLCDRCFSILN